MSLLELARNLGIPEPITFQADVDLADGMPSASALKSYDAPYSECFNSVSDGFVSLGAVPNADLIKEHFFELDYEIAQIKAANADTITVPQGCELLSPVIQLAAAYEKANGADFRQKSAAIIIRDNFAYDNTEPMEWHCDPEHPEQGQRQNVYSFTDSFCTEFEIGGKTNPFELICFSMASKHRRPAIIGATQQKPIKRLFVAVAFTYKPSEHRQISFGSIMPWRRPR